MLNVRIPFVILVISMWLGLCSLAEASVTTGISLPCSTPKQNSVANGTSVSDTDSCSFPVQSGWTGQFQAFVNASTAQSLNTISASADSSVFAVGIYPSGAGIASAKGYIATTRKIQITGSGLFHVGYHVSGSVGGCEGGFGNIRGAGWIFGLRTGTVGIPSGYSRSCLGARPLGAVVSINAVSGETLNLNFQLEAFASSAAWALDSSSHYRTSRQSATAVMYLYIIPASPGADYVSLDGLDYRRFPPPGQPESNVTTMNYARFYDSADPRFFFACQHSDLAKTPCHGKSVAPGTNWTVNYFSTNRGVQGVLRGTSSVFLTGDGSLGSFPSFFTSGARSGFREAVTIGGAVGVGTASFTFRVTGESFSSPGQSGRPQLQWLPVVNGVADFSRQLNFLVNSAGTAVVSFPITFGVRNDFIINFYALAQVFSWVPGASASADYSSTAILTGITIQDASGSPVPNFTMESESGVPYTSAGVVVAVSIDVMPGEDVPTIAMHKNGKIPVAILSSATVDAVNEIDAASLTFGRTGQEQSWLSCSTAPEDVNADGMNDLVCHFSPEATGLAAEDSQVRLKGFTIHGLPIEAVDAVRVR